MAAGEYAIPAQRFIATLLEQRAMKLKSGLYHLNQIQMAFKPTGSRGAV